MRRLTFGRVVATAAILLLAACSGGGGKASSVPVAQGQTGGMTAATVSFTIGNSSQALARRTQSIPASQVQSVVFRYIGNDPNSPPLGPFSWPTVAPTATVGGATFVNLTTNNCTNVAGSYQCTIGGVQLPVGTIDLYVTAYDGLGGAGNAIYGSVTTTTVAANGSLSTALTALVASSTAITEFTLPTIFGQSLAIVSGPDGALWFTCCGKIGRITTTGGVTAYSIPSNSQANAIALGPDGALWFTEISVNKIGRITTTGTVTEYSIPTSNSFPDGIAAGPDGALWFTEQGANNIGRISTSGAITEYSIPPNGHSSGGSQVYGIAAGPDGALWFGAVNFGAPIIGRITTTGAFTEYLLPLAGNPIGITSGPDGALWFADFQGRIGRITTTGAITEYSIATANSQPVSIAAGPDGALWFAEQGANNIGRISTSGTITEYSIPTSNSNPGGIAAGPDGALWFTEQGANKIGRLSP